MRDIVVFDGNWDEGNSTSVQVSTLHAKLGVTPVEIESLISAGDKNSLWCLVGLLDTNHITYTETPDPSEWEGYFIIRITPDSISASN